MLTASQLVRKGRKHQVAKNNVPALDACPQKRGVCSRVKDLPGVSDLRQDCSKYGAKRPSPSSW
jgi:hypothetical protein